MLTLSRQLICVVSLAVGAYTAPAASSSDVPLSLSSALSAPSVSAASSTTETASASAAAASPSTTVPLAPTAANGPIFTPGADVQPSPTRGALGGSILGPQNIAIDQQNPDILAPPTTDHGDVSNAKWPFGLSHNRLQTGGWARQQNIEVMPMATQMAGVNMRLEPGAIRELHWHKTSEWAYVIKGSTQISAVDQDGKNFLATVEPGDLWYFPPGIPHSLQATNESTDGTEFLLVFDDGAFSEDATFLLTDWLSHVPKEVLAKNFQIDMSNFDGIPAQELYIFPAAPPPVDASAPPDPMGGVPEGFSFAMSQMNVTQLSGGTVKIVDSTNFPIATTIAAADVTVEPGAIRELHWHPTQDEWSFFLEGTGRMTIFASQSNARTFDYEAGDVGYVPASMGHYIENVGNTTLHYLEIFKTDRFSDVSLSQWLALTPPALVKAHLGLSDEVIAQLNKTKQVVVGPRTSS
ncbi:oxalate decarboxylase [Stereum hirsutum FP-91666 SS1]|uniref:oxalate decarboxylase n=1 Tax=Stereum hirsutum (strain FP-91666) TaxID=721885 RepID=UPI000440F038|nr:oxalate decarboxylase [Stereum hirsutum FP-91666 SS1]EIM90954.1 oxalate decarboxylase [Stereum hirsutum FP-91666 SS1]